jgi:hypothetical protein
MAIKCFWGIPDVPYHQVKCDDRDCWAEDGDAIPGVSMFVGNYGWNVEREQWIGKSRWRDSRPISFVRGWLEFDDNGKLHKHDQLTAVLKTIGDLKQRQTPIFIVTFMNGWHHNASRGIQGVDGSFEYREQNAI